MQKILKQFLLSIIFLSGFLVWGNAQAANYYVRTDGSDTSCNGTADASFASAPNCAWKTIQKGATIGTCGDIVIVGDGIYTQLTTDEFITINDACSSGSTLTIQAQNKWGAVLQAYAAYAPRELMHITGNYIKVDGFRYQGWKYGTVYSSVLVEGSHNIVTNLYSNQNDYVSIQIAGTYNILSNSYILKPQFGINVGGTGNIIENNEIDQLNNYAVGTDTDYSRYSGRDHIFRGNYFHGADVAALGAAGSHIDCFQTFTEGGNPNSYNILIEKNRCYDSHEGVMASSTTNGSDGLIVRNNIFYNNTAYGVALWDTKNVGVYNNTFSLNGGIYAVGCTNSPATCDVRNNIVLNANSGTASPIYISSGAAWITAPVNNLIYRSGKTYSADTYPYPNIINRDPLFVSSTDYSLQASSPAINAGADLSEYFTTDYLGNIRTENWDIGAYEYNSGSSDTTPPASPTGLSVN